MDLLLFILIYIGIPAALIGLALVRVRRRRRRSAPLHSRLDNFNHVFQHWHCIYCGLPYATLQRRTGWTQLNYPFHRRRN